MPLTCAPPNFHSSTLMPFIWAPFYLRIPCPFTQVPLYPFTYVLSCSFTPSTLSPVCHHALSPKCPFTCALLCPFSWAPLCPFTCVPSCSFTSAPFHPCTLMPFHLCAISPKQKAKTDRKLGFWIPPSTSEIRFLGPHQWAWGQVKTRFLSSPPLLSAKR